ncbi:ERCC4 domain-containing protein [Bacillus thuringiensis]|nr:ERCC4 domain-containing protein [Bacillus thuringiensis]MED2754698.1 ERCC4 domain-containing protein [Bacillus thuringiensis]MED2761951.1 ERCC4 domain-containing protein [Bacillus thuringiensis]MED2771660.1 ERCC4 domain-containing protein [Bacillus thuringiensis]MED2777231.1 ERCC4 domain-containing protein [Bacillus thuringiensis]
MIRFHYTDKEIEKILKTLTIVIDTRENVNDHIRDYLHQKGIPIKNQKLDTGDYGCMIPKNEELGIPRDIYLDRRIERKMSIDEITSNLQKDTQTRFENELIRSKDIPFTLIVEDQRGYEKILKGDYKSRYNPLALLGRLNTFKAKYDFEIVYLDKKFVGNWIYYVLYYHAKHYLKTGAF